jgi:hypothetical protein
LWVIVITTGDGIAVVDYLALPMVLGHTVARLLCLKQRADSVKTSGVARNMFVQQA